MVDLKKYTLDVDLQQGVVPISKAASSLAALIKRSRSQHQPIIVTQKGYPTGVILDVELFTALRELADKHQLDLSDLSDVVIEDDDTDEE